MITVLQCVKELGLAHSPLVLTAFGILVKEHMSAYCHCIAKVSQEENGKMIMVNGYNYKYKDDIMRAIKSYVINRPKKREWMKLMEKTRRYTIEHHRYGWKTEAFLKRNY